MKKKLTSLRKKLELDRATVAVLTDPDVLAQVIGGLRNQCMSSKSGGAASCDEWGC
jgi:hypothetical protein